MARCCKACELRTAGAVWLQHTTVPFTMQSFQAHRPAAQASKGRPSPFSPCGFANIRTRTARSYGKSQASRQQGTNTLSRLEPPAPESVPIPVRQQQPGQSDPNQELIQVLLAASSNELLQSLSSAEQLLRSAATRIQRLVEPPPAGFPPGPSGDQAVTLLVDPLQFLQRNTRQYGGTVGLLLGTERVVLVTDKQLARQVMVDQADIFIKEGTAFFPGSALAGNGLLVSDGDVWRRQRRLSNPAFRKSAIDAYAGAMVSSTQAMLRKWQAGQVRDVYEDFNTLTLEVTLEALFGFRIASSPSDGSGQQHHQALPHARTAGGASDEALAKQIVAAVERAFEFFSRRAGSAFTLPEWVPTLDNLEFGMAVQQLDEVVYSVINRRRSELQQDQAPARSDLLQALMTAVDEIGTGMTDRALRDELMTMLVAGQETSAILLGWSCALLASHPQIQEKSARELAEVLQGRTPAAADVRSLRYIEAVILEALRMYAPAYMVGRCACQDVQLGPYQLEKGTTILVSPYIMHRNPEHWDDPDTFKPERWTPYQEAPGYPGFMAFMSNVGEAVNGAYVPFGAGPRNCIGTGFAMMEAILVLASVLQRYRLSPPRPGADFPKPKPLITLRPEAVPVLLTRR